MIREFFLLKSYVGVTKFSNGFSIYISFDGTVGTR